ncbi:MAG TPA: ABC transporter permease [Gemmatimonadaceae bacterium]|jgi:predicted permease
MSWLRRLRNLAGSNRHSADIGRELAFHLSERTDDLIARGMTPEAAAQEARRQFGNYGGQKERTRDAGVLTSLDTFVADLRYAIRALRHSRAFALIAILSLALGIGANTAIFTLIDAVMLRSLPVSHPEELVQVQTSDGGSDVTNPIWEAMRDRQSVFSGVFAYASNDRFNLTTGGEPRYANGDAVSGDFFRTLGVQPELGRLLSMTDDRSGCEPTAVLSDAFWRSVYGADQNVVGKTISLDSHLVRIVGVSQAGFNGLDVGKSAQVFVPLCADPVLTARADLLTNRSEWFLTMIGRRKDGLSSERVQAGLRLIAPAVFAATVPDGASADRQTTYMAQGFATAPVGTGMSALRQQYSGALLALMGIVALVLLIACANVANLLLARAASRQRELAIRVALGSARGRLIRQLLTESVLISAIGAAIGLLFARWGCRLLVAFLSTADKPIYLDLSVDRRVLGFNIAVAVLTGLGFGLGPALRAARVDPNAALKSNGRGTIHGQRRWTVGKALVVAQIAISLTLVVGAGLLVGTFRRLATVDPGFAPDGVMLVRAELPPGSPDGASKLAAQTDVLRRLRAVPGVTSASLSVLTPLTRAGWNGELDVDGYVPRSRKDAIAFFNETTSGYFQTLGTPLLAGRDFESGDRIGSPKVAIVNVALGLRFFSTPNPVGRVLRVKQGKRTGDPVTIVGVVKDAKYNSLRAPAPPTVYLATSQDTAVGTSLNAELRVTGGVSSIVPDVKAVLADVSPRVTVTFMPFATQLNDSIKRERLLATLSGFFGALALLLAMLGLYGVMAYNVARRRNEIGIRMALGAAQQRVAGMVLGEVATMLVVGLLLGGALTVGATRLIKAFLFGMGATDPATFGGAIALLAAVGLIAAYLPARRAAGVDPMQALRDE